jgi:hypothetical protein
MYTGSVSPTPSAVDLTSSGVNLQSRNVLNYNWTALSVSITGAVISEYTRWAGRRRWWDSLETREI